MGRLSSPRHRLAGLAFLLALGAGLVMTVPALADFLGPDRHVVEMVEVRAPANDYWTCGNRNPPPGVNGTCILQNLTNPNPCPDAGGYHPSKEQQRAWCQWGTNYPDYTGCGCTQAYTYQTIEYDLPEATISGDLQGCVLSNGWCVSAPTLHLQGAEPLAGYEILALEGTRNSIPGGGGDPFACPGGFCDVPLLEGANAFTFWALSSYGDSSQMGSFAGRVDTQAPDLLVDLNGVEGESGWWVSEVLAAASAWDPVPGSGVESIQAQVEATGWMPYAGPVPLGDGLHPIGFRASDYAGNTSEVSDTVAVDTTPPATAYVDPPEGTERWVSGSIRVAGFSQDATSGVASVELSTDGGGSWGPAGLDGGGSWSAAWDTLSEADGSRQVFARARDQAGNLGPAAQVVLLVDNTPPAVNLPDRWEISEPIVLTAADTGSGVDRLEVTIQGEGLGVRQYTYMAETAPGSWMWDGTLGDSLAPAGEYAVMLAAWDLVGNRGEDIGVLVIPAPAASAPVTPEVTRAWVVAPPPASPAPATEPPASGAVLLVLTPVPPAPTAAPALEAALPQESIPEAPQPSVPAAAAAGNGNGVLWGAAALALIGGVTAYVVSRREERRRRAAEELAAKQRQAAEWAAQAAGLRARVEANYQAIQAYAIAIAAAAAEAVRRARDEWFERREERWEEEEIARQERAEEEARRQREAEAEARRLAAATAQLERLRGIAEGREGTDIGTAKAESGEPTILDQVIRVVSSFLQHVSLQAPIQQEYRIPLLPTSQFTSTEYLVRCSVRLRSPAETPSVVVDPATSRVSVPILGGSWSYSFREGAISITRASPWSFPVPGVEDSIAQVRWSTTWGIGTYGGELGVRQALNLDSRVVIADRELSNTSASLISTTRFRPQNILYQWGTSAVAVLVVLGGPPVWAGLAGAADALSRHPELVVP
jgi:hypothetical protein